MDPTEDLYLEQLQLGPMANFVYLVGSRRTSGWPKNKKKKKVGLPSLAVRFRPKGDIQVLLPITYHLVPDIA